MLHFQVRSVLLSNGRSAITLAPIEWCRWVHNDGTLVDIDLPLDEGALDDADFQLCAPGDQYAEPSEADGKLTEVRVEGETPWRPGDYISFPDPAVFGWDGITDGIKALHGTSLDSDVFRHQP